MKAAYPASCLLAELQPEFFCEAPPELAADSGSSTSATIVIARNAIEARVLLTERTWPLHVPGRVVH